MRTVCQASGAHMAPGAFASSLLMLLVLRRNAESARHSPLAGWLARSFSGSAGFRESHYWTPPVNFLQGTEPPTALQWLRRRGPSLPNGVLQQLFRQRRVKVCCPASGRVQRAAKSLPLPPGARLLIPADVAASAADLQTASQHAWHDRRLEGVGADLRRRVLYMDEELLVLDKPAGLAVQGGPGVPASIDRLAAHELRFGSSHAPRLAHRLDREVSGALVLGRTPDATAWLSAAFRRPSDAGGQQADLATGTGAAVGKRYWAVVEEAAGGLPRSGSIAQPLLVRGAAGPAEKPALTRFSMRAWGGGLAWLQLEPVTGTALPFPASSCPEARLGGLLRGRKHQLRLHCAQALGSPIVGDTRYGAARPAGPEPEEGLRDASPLLQALRPRLQLHCRSLTFRVPGRAAWEVVAPPPPHMRALLQTHGWLGPEEEDG